MPHEYAFEMATSAIRFGFGATREVGADLVDLGAKNVLVFTDPYLRRLPPVQNTLESLESNGILFTIFDRVQIEPTDESFREAIRAASGAPYDAFVAVGGGSVIDTAKAANLYSCWPAELLEYVNPPIGRGMPVPGPVKQLIAIPTTAGTGSETTGVAIFDYKPLRAKTGIAHRRLKPTLGIVDPENTRTLPPAVAASSGLDVLSHAIESWTAVPFRQRPATGASDSAAGLPRVQPDQRFMEHGSPEAHGAPIGAGGVRARTVPVNNAADSHLAGQPAMVSTPATSTPATAVPVVNGHRYAH